VLGAVLNLCHLSMHEDAGVTIASQYPQDVVEAAESAPEER
jgi:hypothetical protein